MNKGEKAYNSLLSRYEKKLTELRNFKKKLNDFENRTCESCRYVGYRLSDKCSYCSLNNTVYVDPVKEKFYCNRYVPKENK